MPEPIISPWFVYFLEAYAKLKIVLAFLILSLLIVSCYYIIVSVRDSNFTKNRNKLIMILILLICLNIFLPSKNTIIAMYALKYTTYENVMKVYNLGHKIGEDFRTFTISFIRDVLRELQNSKTKDYDINSKESDNGS